MQKLKGLLDAIKCQATFRTRSREGILTAELRENYELRGWPPSEEMIDARLARPIVSEESISILSNHLRLLLKDFVDPNDDFIGHAFPAGDIPGVVVMQDNELIGEGWRSPVRTFAKSLIKASAVLGTERVTRLVSYWIQGKPVEYKTMVMLNALPVIEPLALDDGLYIDCLSLSTDRLPANLPHHSGMSAEDYLGRTVLVIDTTASPTFFRPQTYQSEEIIQTTLKLNVDVATVCQALSLSSDSYVDVGFFWSDYQELDAFSFVYDSGSWSPSGARVRERMYTFSSYINISPGVTRIIPRDAEKVLDLRPAEIPLVYNSLKSDDFNKIRLAIARWIMSKGHERSQVDKFIDLRIALESLYLHNIGNDKYRGEMRLRLALCGAWHLGVTFEERRRIFEKLRGAYDTASRVVHGGELKGTTETEVLLSDAQDLCRQGILKVLREGYPSQGQWGDLVLGVEVNED